MKNVPTPISVIVMMKVYLRPTMSPRRPKTSAAKRANGEAGGERKQREDESRRRIDTGKELRRENRRQRAVDIKIVPLEHGAERRREDDHPFLGCHRAFAVLTRSHCCHGRCPCLSIVGLLVGNRLFWRTTRKPSRSRNTTRVRARLCT